MSSLNFFYFLLVVVPDADQRVPPHVPRDPHVVDDDGVEPTSPERREWQRERGGELARVLVDDLRDVEARRRKLEVDAGADGDVLFPFAFNLITAAAAVTSAHLRRGVDDEESPWREDDLVHQLRSRLPLVLLRRRRRRRRRRQRERLEHLADVGPEDFFRVLDQPKDFPLARPDEPPPPADLFLRREQARARRDGVELVDGGLDVGARGSLDIPRAARRRRRRRLRPTLGIRDDREELFLGSRDLGLA